MEHDAQAQALYFLYKNQYGGALYPVFRGGRQLQYGEGFGDIFKSIWTWVFPVVSSGAGTFLEEMVKKKGEGIGWKEAANSAIQPTIMEAVSRGAEQVSKVMDESKKSQEGRGRKRRKRRHSVYKGHQLSTAKSKSHPSLPKYNF